MHVLLDHADMLYQHAVLVAEHAQHAAALALIGAGDHFHGIVAL